MSEKQHKKHERAPDHQGSVAAADGELTTWIHSFWARGEYPHRIELWQVFGRNGLERGHRLHAEDFKPNEKVDPERANRVANELIRLAQHDTDVRGRTSLYQVDVVDPNRGAVPTIRRLGPLSPQQAYIVKAGSGAGGGHGDDEDDDTPLSGRNISLAYVKEGFDQDFRNRQLNYRVLGDVIGMQREDNAELRAIVREFMQLHIASVKAQAEAEDRKAEREIRLLDARFWLDVKKEGVRTVRNILPGFFAPAPAPDPQPTQGSSLPERPAASRLNTFSPEKVLVCDFLADCEKEGIDNKLFGEWAKDDEGNLIPIEGKQGIFRPDQCKILFGIAMGALPPDALDTILPGSTDPRAISMEQADQAGKILPMSMQQAIVEMIGLRQKARASAPASTPTAER